MLKSIPVHNNLLKISQLGAQVFFGVFFIGMRVLFIFFPVLKMTLFFKLCSEDIEAAILASTCY